MANKSVPWWWMRNEKGSQSVSVTFAAVSFFVTTLVYLGSAFEKIGPVTFRHFDVSAAMTYFIPAISLYFGRKLTDAKYALPPAVSKVVSQVAESQQQSDSAEQNESVQ
jgi:hypothetical protein